MVLLVSSGKDSFCYRIKEIMGNRYVHVISTVDIIKDIAFNLGWDGKKTPKDRKFLSDLKDLLTEWNDIPFKYVKNKIKSIENTFEYYDVDFDISAIFIMCREPKEIERLKKELNAKTILVRRAEAEAKQSSNHADSEVFNYNYDIIIDNNGTLLDLTHKALDFIESEQLFFPHWKNFSIGLNGEIIEN